MGFKKEEVKGIQENVFRPSQIEVTFEKDVELDINEIEKKLKERKVPYVPAKFKHCEEVLMVYGLPFVNDIEKLKEELKDSVRAFVGKIVECSPTYYQRNDQRGEYFCGKLTGAWRLKVVPKKDMGIPNFIVVGKEKVQGKVTYTNKSSVRITQCANCFSEEHLMNDGSCQGIRRWSNYCNEFEERWQNALRVPIDMEEEETESTDTFYRGDEILKEEVSKVEKRIEEVEEDKRRMLAEIENLKEFRREEDREREELRDEIKRLKEVEKKAKEQEVSEERLREEVKSLQEKVNENEKKLQDKNGHINELENSGEVLASLIEAKAAFDNMMDGVKNNEDVRKPSVEDDPLDIASSQGEEIKMDSDDEVIAEILQEIVEDGYEGNIKRVANSAADDQQMVKQRKINKLGLPEVKDRVWVRNSESEETKNYEVVKTEEPDNPQRGSFECKSLDGGGDGELVVDFYKHQLGYHDTPKIRTKSGSPPFYGFPPNPPPVPPPIPPRHRRNSSRSIERESVVIQRTNSFSK